MITPEEWLKIVGEPGIRQTIGELRAYAQTLRANQTCITASQIECLCDLSRAWLEGNIMSDPVYTDHTCPGLELNNDRLRNRNEVSLRLTGSSWTLVNYRNGEQHATISQFVYCPWCGAKLPAGGEGQPQ